MGALALSRRTVIPNDSFTGELTSVDTHEAPPRDDYEVLLPCRGTTPHDAVAELKRRCDPAVDIRWGVAVFPSHGTTADRLIERADTGTVFLDEIGELDPQAQTKLLRVLEEHTVRRIGSVKPIPVDVRFIAATNRNLEAEVAAGRFRSDLYYRLNGFSLVISPLRERVGEIGPLAETIVSRARGGQDARISSCAHEVLRTLRWPGNVRELRNPLERAVILAGDDDIRPEHLVNDSATAAASPELPPTFGGTIEPMSLKQAVEAAERYAIELALSHCDANQTDAAKLLGISRQTLISRLDAYAMPRPRKPNR